MDRCNPDAVSNTMSFLGTGEPKLNSKINQYISRTKQREKGKAKSESIEDRCREEHERKSHLKNNSNSLKDLQKCEMWRVRVFLGGGGGWGRSS